jgi:hypothetical protein
LGNYCIFPLSGVVNGEKLIPREIESDCFLAGDDMRLLIVLMVLLCPCSAAEQKIFDLPFSEQTESVQATLQYSIERQGRVSLHFWVENSVWSSQERNGLNGELSADPVEDRNLTLRQFAEWMDSELLNGLEASYFSVAEVPGTAHPGLNFLFLDIKDDFESRGSFYGSHFYKQDQIASSGFNLMNLIYMDTNPATLYRSLYDGVTRQKLFFEITRTLARLLLYQRDSDEKLWVREGISQFLIYRMFGDNRTYPMTRTRILNVPDEAPAEVSSYLGMIESMRPGYPHVEEYSHLEQQQIENTAETNLDRVFVFRNPRDISDNSSTPYFRGWSYLFFTYLFQRAGGDFTKNVTDGDRFFRSLTTETKDGIEGLEEVLAEYSMPDFRTVYTDFVQSLFLDYNDVKYRHAAIRFTENSSLESVTKPLNLNLKAYQFRFLKLQNTSSSLKSIMLEEIPARYQYAHMSLYSKDEQGRYLQEKIFDEGNLQTYLLPGDTRYLLLINLDTDVRMFRVRMALEQMEDKVFFPDSRGEYGPTSTVIALDNSHISSSLETGSIDISLPESGIYSFQTENRSDYALVWSVENNEQTTQVSLQSSSRLKLSVSQILPATTQKSVIIQNKSSKQNMTFINEKSGQVSFSLFYKPVSADMVEPESGTSSSSGGTSGSSQTETAAAAGGGAGGCFIATASFGSLTHPLVRILCDFRDRILLHSSFGQQFVSLYYQYSPPVAEVISSSFILRGVTQILLLPLVFLAFILLNPPAGILFLISGFIFAISRRRAHA